MRRSAACGPPHSGAGACQLGVDRPFSLLLVPQTQTSIPHVAEFERGLFGWAWLRCDLRIDEVLESLAISPRQLRGWRAGRFWVSGDGF